MLKTELKATTNQKLSIYDTVAPGPTADFLHGIQLLGGRHHHWIPTFLNYFWSELHCSDCSKAFSLCMDSFFFFFSWMYDLGVWARMTGSSKAQGRGIPIIFLGYFSYFFGRPFDILAGIACCCRLSDEKQTFQGHNWRILYGP